MLRATNSTWANVKECSLGFVVHGYMSACTRWRKLMQPAQARRRLTCVREGASGAGDARRGPQRLVCKLPKLAGRAVRRALLDRHKASRAVDARGGAQVGELACACTAGQVYCFLGGGQQAQQQRVDLLVSGARRSLLSTSPNS